MLRRCTAAAATAFRLLNQERDKRHRREESPGYARSFYAGYGTSLTCENVCPAGIPVSELVSRSITAAMERRF